MGYFITSATLATFASVSSGFATLYGYKKVQKWVDINERDTLKLESFYEGKSPPCCTNGKPIDFLFRISYKCRSEDECNNLVDQVANNCTKEQCPSQDEDFYDERGIPKCLDE